LSIAATFPSFLSLGTPDTRTLFCALPPVLPFPCICLLGLCSQEAVSLKIRNFYQNAAPPRVAPAVARDRRQRAIARPRRLIADAG
jgi:hypothetical protein